MTDTQAAVSASAQRARIQTKLKALLAMTVENGCTEAEAMSAAQKAAKLMEDYDLTYVSTDDVKSERYGARKRNFSRSPNARKRSLHEAHWTADAIGRFLDCRAWVDGKQIVFFGSEHDTEVAHNMIDLIRIAMEGEWARYLYSPSRDQFVHGRTLRRPFMEGMARRISERLDEMRAVRERATHSVMQSTGRALVLQARREITTEKFATYARERGLHLSKPRPSSYRAHAGASEAGRRAGDCVGFSSDNIGGAGVRAIVRK